MSMKTGAAVTVAVGVAGILLATAGLTAEGAAAKTEAAPPAKTEAKAQTTCPVMGGAIDRKVFVDHEGKRVYLCCAGCTAPFKKEPAKYLKKLQDAGVTVEDAPKADTGKAGDAKTGG